MVLSSLSLVCVMKQDIPVLWFWKAEQILLTQYDPIRALNLYKLGTEVPAWTFKRRCTPARQWNWPQCAHILVGGIIGPLHVLEHSTLYNLNFHAYLTILFYWRTLYSCFKSVSIIFWFSITTLIITCWQFVCVCVN